MANVTKTIVEYEEKRNLGDYENATVRIGRTIKLGDDDDIRVVEANHFKDLQEKVRKKLRGRQKDES